MNPAPFDAACFRAGLVLLACAAVGVAALVVTWVTL